MSAGQVQPSRACTRCGITRRVVNTHRVDHGLCRDCEYLAKYKPKKRRHRPLPVHVVDLRGKRLTDDVEILIIQERRLGVDWAMESDLKRIRARENAA